MKSLRNTWHLIAALLLIPLIVQWHFIASNFTEWNNEDRWEQKSEFTQWALIHIVILPEVIAFGGIIWLLIWDIRRDQKKEK